MSHTNSTAALNYRGVFGFSIIPVGRDKKPLIKSWLEYQERIASVQEVTDWFKNPDAMVGIVTGKISNLAVVDIDTDEGAENLRKVSPVMYAAPTVTTPSGGSHLYYQFTEGLRNKAGVIPGTDLRADGGYVVAPPSVGMNGVEYEWDPDLNLSNTSLSKLPEEYVQAVKNTAQGKTYDPATAATTFTEGRRDDDLFHLAHSLVKGGMRHEEIIDIVLRAALTCVPPFPEREAIVKVRSAVERAMRKERNLSQEMRDWIVSTSGYFTTTEMYNGLQLTTRQDQRTAIALISRFIEEGLVEKYGDKNGVYRHINRETVPMHWKNAAAKEIVLEFPLDIADLVKIYPKNIIVVAGNADAGKTAFFLDFIKKNQDDHKINYFNSEMGEDELRIRLSKHEDMELEDWKFNAYERSSNFQDVIGPDDINIIDFLEVTEDFYRVGSEINQIFRKLNKGIALIGLQKKRGCDVGRGGDFTLEKPRLYLSMENGYIKVIKAKNWQTTRNPNGLHRLFKVVQGAIFIPTSPWEE